MGDIRNSAVLEKLLAAAKRENKPLATVENLVAAALDLLCEPEHMSLEEGAELLMFREALRPYGDLKELSDMLKNRGGSDPEALQEGNQALQGKMIRAKALVRASNKEELTADLLLGYLLKNPTEILAECLSEAREKAAKAAAERDTGEDKKKQDTMASLMAQIKKAKSDSGWMGHREQPEREREEEPQQRRDSEEQKSGETAEAVIAEPPSKEKIAELVDVVRRMRSELLQVIYGQDNAISVFTNGYFQGELTALVDRQRRRPRATFLFAGPPGVGKTYLAETAAGVMKLPFKRFDMSEYSDEMSVRSLTGSEKVFVGSENGVLSDFVSKHPKCVLLFDEVEKAHIKAIHLFLQILDAGRLTDTKTHEEVSFADTIVIFTTNAGKELYDGEGLTDLSGLSRKVILSALAEDKDPRTDVPYFPAAICSRFASGNVVMFNHMTASSLRSIAKKVITTQTGNLEREVGIRTDVDEKVFTALLLAEGGTADARMLTGRTQSFYNGELFELFRLVDSEKVPGTIADIEDIRFRVQLPEGNPEIRALFEVPKDMQVLLFSDTETADWCALRSDCCRICGVQEAKTAGELLRNQDIRFVLIDQSYGRSENRDGFLNVEDVDSRARDFFWLVREKFADLPIYFLTRPGREYTDEEEISFRRSGVQGFLRMDESFETRMAEICENLHQQDNVTKLARSNKLISFETGQRVSPDGKEAEICLFDFEQATAVDAKDSDNILSGMSIPEIRFDEVIGAEEAKKELRYFVEYLRNPRKYVGTGVSAPKGVLLYGPPGTGKTMLAKAFASESGVTFIPTEGNSFLKKYVGEGPQSVHDRFLQARKYAPSVLFIDEIDAIAKTRSGSEFTQSSDEILTALLTEMDGFRVDPNRPVFVLAATNYNVDPGQGGSLDPALLRRFDRRICVDLPNKAERIRYLRMQTGKKKNFKLSDQMIENIAIRSTGMSLASLASVIELSLRIVIRSGGLEVDDAIFEEAFESFIGGEEKKWDVRELDRTARHEAGHALLSWLAGDKPSYLTIVARGNHGGYMQHGDQESKGSYTRNELLGRIRTALGGRAAEIVYYGAEEGLSTGPSGDLATATRLARAIVCTYGMDPSFGLAVIDPRDRETPEVRSAVNLILKQEMENAIRLIRENRYAIDTLVDQLLKNNRLNGDEIDDLLSGCVRQEEED